MKISAILAIGSTKHKDKEESIIGLNGSLPWVSKEDLKYFSSITKGHCVLMGRNTYLSLNKPLPNRTNIVISKQNNQNHQNHQNLPNLQYIKLFTSIEDGIKYAKQQNENELFIIGGASVYKYCQEKQLLDRIYVSHMKL